MSDTRKSCYAEPIIRVFPRRTKWTPTDGLAFVGEPPFFVPEDRKMPVMISVTFTWDLAEAERLRRAWRAFFRDVSIGGPACGDRGDRFVPGRFIKPGVTITSRGCNRQCPWCSVWPREGEVRTLQIMPGHIVQDNNLLACPREHIEAVFAMLANERGVVFAGGLDARLFTAWHRDLLETIAYAELWFAADTVASLATLATVAGLCNGISIEKLRCYVLVGFSGEKLIEAERRLETVYKLGFLPFAQLYRAPGQSRWGLSSGESIQRWNALIHKWSRPAAYRCSAKIPATTLFQ